MFSYYLLSKGSCTMELTMHTPYLLPWMNYFISWASKSLEGSKFVTTEVIICLLCHVHLTKKCYTPFWYSIQHYTALIFPIQLTIIWHYGIYFLILFLSPYTVSFKRKGILSVLFIAIFQEGGTHSKHSINVYLNELTNELRASLKICGFLPLHKKIINTLWFFIICLTRKSQTDG